MAICLAAKETPGVFRHPFPMLRNPPAWLAALVLGLALATPSSVRADNEAPGVADIRTILREVKKPGATVVVQPGCRNRLLRQRQTGEHVARKCVAGGAVVEDG